MSTIDNVIIAAAGIGKRLGLDMPKALVKIGGEPIIKHQLDLLRDIKNIYVVVGFRGEELIDYVTKIRKDAIFVINHNYAQTNTLNSLQLALRYIKTPFIFMDGDLCIEKNDFYSFLNQSRLSPQNDLIGITHAKTEDGVYVELDKNNKVINFTRNTKFNYEWLGLAYFKNANFFNEDNQVYVFNAIQKHLPLDSFLLRAYEIDTIKDLELAQNNMFT